MFGKKKKPQESKTVTTSSNIISSKQTSSSTYTSSRWTQSTTTTTVVRQITNGSSSYSGQSNKLGIQKNDVRNVFPTSSSPTNKPINLNYQSPYRSDNSFNGQFRSSLLNRVNHNDAKPFTPAYSPPDRKTSLVATPNSLSLYSSTPKESTKSLSAAEKTIKLEVKKTGKRYDNNNTIPVYQTHGKKRGEVLIINNIKFAENSERAGAKSDDENLKKVFKQLNFTIKSERDLKADQMKSVVKKFSQRSDLKNVDMTIVIIMSHGTNRQHVSGTEIFGIDDKSVSTDDILNYFTAENCKHLAGKPKIFIFQCCRSYETFQKTDNSRGNPIGHADMLIAFSTLPGFVSYRDPQSGTWYIQTLCTVLCEHAHEYHIEELLKIVDDRIVKVSGMNQTTTYESRGFKRCYLHP